MREFALRLEAPVKTVLRRCAERGVNAGYALGRDYPEFEDGLLVAITERRSREHIDRLADVLGAAVAAERERARRCPRERAGRLRCSATRVVTIFERSRRAAARRRCPSSTSRRRPLDELIPRACCAPRARRLPEVSEPEIVRHYNRLSRRNFDLDTGFYPLGSCTMKHNPKVNERVAALPGHARLHPLQPPERAQGALELMWLLQRALSEICGLPHVSLQPSAGAHGELAGLLLTRAYHADRGESRHKVLTPDTAHGTNPATVTMAGYEVVKVATDERGGIDVDDLRAKADDDVACLMLTNPNTLGLFDERIEEIAEIVHDTGATLYYDGANLNAVMGISRPGDMGFDIVHVNLHKSFSQPHGGGGPGAGPIAVSERIEPFLPRPQVVRGADERRRAVLRPRLRPAEVDRPPARLPGQLRRVRALLHLHPEPRRRRPARGVGDRRAERQLPARPHERGPRGKYLPVAFDRPACTSSCSRARARRRSSA